MIFIGFYTEGTAYEQEAHECITTLEKFGLAHDFVGVPNRGDWTRNCAQKPKVILDAMLKHSGPLVYLDADARVRQRPDLFWNIRPSIPVACHYRYGAELLSGTLYFSGSYQSGKLVELWHAECERSPDDWDQVVLARVIEAERPAVFRLPSEYTRVFDDPKMGDPVVEHMQASRRHRNAVGVA